MVSQVGSNAATNQTNPSTGSASQAGLLQQDFLQLMVAQVKNQDPLDPQTNGDFLAQLAQFSTNDGINSMKDSINTLVTALQSNQALQASALVGKKVLVNNSNLALGNEGGVTSAINMVSGLTDLTASIYSSTGNLVKTIPLGQLPTGIAEFNWDGTDQSNQRVAAGNYTVKVTGKYNGQAVGVSTMTSGNVDSVSLGQNGSGITLNVGGIGAVTLDQVKQISA